MEKKMFDELVEVMEEHDFNVGEKFCERDNEFTIDIGQCTPECEDWFETIWFDGTDEGLVEAVRKRAEDFDIEEEAEIWIDRRGKNGVPNSILAILEDAEWKKDMLLELAKALEKCISGEEDVSSMTEAEEKEMHSTIRSILAEAVSDEYADRILEDGEKFVTAVMNDVIECSDWEEDKTYSDSDVRYAIGRQLMDLLKIEC